MVRKKFMALFSCWSSRTKMEPKAAVERATTRERKLKAGRSQRRECLARAPSTFVQMRPLLSCTCSVTLGALHAALDPVERFYPRRRIDAFGGKVLDVDQIDALGVGIIFGAAESDRLDRLMSVGKLHLNEAAGRLPFEPCHGLDQFIGRGLLAAIFGHGFFDCALPPEYRLRHAIGGPDRIDAVRGFVTLEEPVVDRRFLRHQAVGAAGADDGAVGHLVAERRQHMIGGAEHHLALLRATAGTALQGKGLEVAAPQARK